MLLHYMRGLRALKDAGSRVQGFCRECCALGLPPVFEPRASSCQCFDIRKAHLL